MYHLGMVKRSAIIPIGPSIAYVPLTNGLYALIDASDVPLVEGRNWNAFVGKRRGGDQAVYAYSSHRPMHRVLLECEAGEGHGMMPDHRNGNTLDNRKAGNLRWATRAENNRNRRVRHDSSSGIKGVRLRKDTGRWRAEVEFEGKKYNCGQFDTAEEAKTAYERKAKELHRDFVRAA